jgi:hypothetical protein
MPDSSRPQPKRAAAQTDAAALLATLLVRHPHLPWSVTTPGRKLIGTSLSDDPSLQRAETRAWARAVGVTLTEARSCDTTYLCGQALLDGVRLFLHTMIIIGPDEGGERLLAGLLGEQ